MIKETSKPKTQERTKIQTERKEIKKRKQTQGTNVEAGIHSYTHSGIP